MQLGRCSDSDGGVGSARTEEFRGAVAGIWHWLLGFGLWNVEDSENQVIDVAAIVGFVELLGGNGCCCCREPGVKLSLAGKLNR